VNFSIRTFLLPEPIVRTFPPTATDTFFTVGKVASFYQLLENTVSRGFRVDILDLSDRSVSVFSSDAIRLGDTQIPLLEFATFNEDASFLAFAIQGALVALNIKDPKLPSVTEFRVDDEKRFNALKMHDAQEKVWLVAASSDHQVVILDLVNNLALATLRISGWSRMLAIDQEGVCLVSICQNARWHCWNLQDPDYAACKTRILGKKKIKDAMQSLDKTHIITLNILEEFSLRDIKTAQEVKTFRYPGKALSCRLFDDFLKFFIDGHRVLVREMSGLKIWDIESNQIIALNFPDFFNIKYITCVSEKMILGSYNGDIKIYDTDVLKKISTYKKIIVPDSLTGYLLDICAHEEFVLM
jgi:WD40 repeat protein